MATPLSIANFELEEEFLHNLETIRNCLAQVTKIPDTNKQRDWDLWREKVNTALTLLKEQKRHSMHMQVEFERNLVEYYKLNQINSYDLPIQSLPQKNVEEKHKQKRKRKRKNK